MTTRSEDDAQEGRYLTLRALEVDFAQDRCHAGGNLPENDGDMRRQISFLRLSFIVGLIPDGARLFIATTRFHVETAGK